MGFAERARTDAGAQVWIHQADAEAARTGKPGWKNEGSTFSYLLRSAFYRTAFSLARGAVKIVPVKEVSSFGDGVVIDVPGSPRALHTPGHTPGSAAIAVEKRNALLTGDAMCTWNPYTGRVGPQIMPSALNMSSAQAMASLDALLAVTAGILLPGHGDPFTQGIPEAGRRAQAAGRSQPAEPRQRPPACTPRRVGPGMHAPRAHPRARPPRRLPPHCLRTPKLVI